MGGADGQQPSVASPGTVAPVARRYKRGHCVPWHDHPWPQLLYASSGVLRVETPTGSWIVPPQRGVWLPPGHRHETRMLTDVELSSLYLPRTPEWTGDCAVIEISPLLRELILLAVRADESPSTEERRKLALALMELELRSAPRVGSAIPMPADPRLAEFCRRVIAAPSVEISLEQHAQDVGLTPKTVSRMFQRDLGLGFREWRQMVQVSYAVAHLVQGEPVKAVAAGLGYTPSAFTVMVRRSTGLTPAALRELRPDD